MDLWRAAFAGKILSYFKLKKNIYHFWVIEYLAMVWEEHSFRSWPN